MSISPIILRQSTRAKSHCPFSPLPSNRSERCTSLVFFSPVTLGWTTISGISKSSEVRFFTVWKIPNHFLVHQPETTNSVLLQSIRSSHLQQLWSDPHLESDWRSVNDPFCGNNQRVKAVGCFRSGAPSFMIGNSVLAEGFPHWGYTREFLAPPAS